MPEIPTRSSSVPDTHLDGPRAVPPGGAGADSVPVNRRIVTWDVATGEPVVRTTQVFTRAQVSELAMAAASMLYTTPDDELAVELGLPPSEFYGKTNLEVMLIKQARGAALTGDSQEVERILDRLIGRPKTTSESKSLELTYEDYLKEIARKAGGE